MLGAIKDHVLIKTYISHFFLNQIRRDLDAYSSYAIKEVSHCESLSVL